MTKSLVLFMTITILSLTAQAQIDVEFDENKRHHLSVVFGGTTLFDAEETAFTLGVDYEYRINELIGVGGVVEYAFGDIDATTLLAVADIHLWKGLALQAGPGVEWIDDETFAIGRVGLLYEFERCASHFARRASDRYASVNAAALPGE